MAEIIRRIETKSENAMNIVNDVRNTLINNKVKTLVNNFPKTLDFIMARIPAQGKQSFIHARMKNLVFSSKNSVYGPLELVLLAGLDYDIDKQNMMTWGLNDEGSIVDWKQYMINGNLSVDKLSQKIDLDADIIKQSFSEDKVRLEDALKNLNTKLETVPEYGDERTNLTLKKNAIEAHLINLDDKLTETLEQSDDANRVLFAKAGQNFIVHNLTEVISSPKNAIEASTPISMTTVSNATILPKVDDLFTTKLGLEDLLMSQQITSNMNPYSTVQYEKITMDGKSSIGIFASDLKAYLATFYATRMATKEDQPHIMMKTDLSKLNITQSTRFGVTPNVLQFFKSKFGLEWNSKKEYKSGETAKLGDYVYTALTTIPAGTPIKTDGNTNAEFWKLEPEIVNMPFIANATRWSESGKVLSKAAMDAKEELKKLDPKDSDGQYNVLLKYAEGMNMLNSMNVEEQAWEGLSQLLSAATDNAKELILGKIGANNTTNSIISTMVRMGVGLSDAIKIINHKSITQLVTDIEKGSDLKVKANANRELAVQGIVQEDAFNAKFADRLSKQVPNVPGEFASDEQMFDYLTNPSRTLHTYAKISAEFAVVSKLLSINQGLKNSGYEVYSYITTINDSMNKAIADYNKEHKENQIDYNSGEKPGFDIAQFVYDVSENQTGKVNELLDVMDKIRSGVNVPYILLKNAHYFSYFEALFQAESIRDRLSYTNKYTADIIDSAKALYGKRNITDKVYKKVSDTVYDFGVLTYLAQQKPIELRGKIFDLSKPKGDGMVLGRSELLQTLPNILFEVQGNKFVDSLRRDRSVVDMLTGVNIQVLKGMDLGQIDSQTYADLVTGLNDIKVNDKELYTALFNYSLITTKGGYAGGSYAGLFDIGEYLKFSDSLKKNSGKIKAAVAKRKNLEFLLNPVLLPQVSTVAQVGKYSAQEDFDDEAFIYETMVEDSPDFYDPGGNSQVYWKNLNKEKFIVDHLNDEKKKLNSYITSDFIRSKNTGLVYNWNKTLEIWVPLTREVPEIGIPWTLPSANQDYIELDKTAGYTQGFIVNLPREVPTILEDGKRVFTNAKGTVVGYISNTMKGGMNRYLKSISDPTATPIGTTLSQKMQSILMNDAWALDLKKIVYIIKPTHGDYYVATKAELEASNAGYVFDEGYIAAGSKVFDNVESKSDPTIRLYEKDSKYYRTEVPGSIVYDATVTHRATEANPVIYDEETIKKMVSDVNKGERTLDTNYNEAKVNNEYSTYINTLTENLLAAELGVPLEKADSIIRLSARMGRTNREALKRVINRIDSYLGTNPSVIEKVNILTKAQEGYIEIFNKMGVDLTNLKSYPNVDFPDPNKVVGALYNFINSKTVKDNVTRIPLSEFRVLTDLLGLPESSYDNYINSKYLTESGIDIITRPDGLVYVKRSKKISLTKQLASIEDKIVKGKSLLIPNSIKYEYTQPANKSVLYSLTNFLNTRLPGVAWNLMTTTQIKEKYGDKFASDKGFFKSNGEVIINLDNASLETPLHEFGHVYLQYLNEEDPGEYQRIMNLASRHELFNTMGKQYGKISKTDLSEEVFCELLSMSSTDRLITDKGGITEEIIDSLSDSDSPFGKVIKKFTNWIKSMFGLSIDHKLNLSMSDSLGSVITNLSDEILYGKQSILSNFSEETKDNVRKSRTASSLTTQEAKDILMSRGYIEWYCV